MNQRDNELRYWRGLGEHMRRERDEMARELERATRQPVNVAYAAANREARKRLKAYRLTREAEGIEDGIALRLAPLSEASTELDRPVCLPDYANDTVARRLIRRFRKSRKATSAEHFR